MSVNLRTSFLDQMKLPGLIDLSLLLILTSTTKGQTWNVSVTRHINALLGSDVDIPCTFTYPPEHHTKDVQVYWKKPERSTFNINDNDKNAFVFHTNETFVVEKYKGKTKLTGDKVKGNCSLKIQNIMENEPNIYVRVIAKGDNYSFKTDFVSISVSGVTPVSLDQDIIVSSTSTPLTTAGTTKMGMTSIYTATFVPVALLLIIIFVAGIVFYIKHKRSQAFTREESGYYANFSTASSNQAKREAFCKKQDNKKLPELKAIDEPVYINIEAPPGQMDQSMDHTDNIYANEDYSK
ncbi:sialic acid-binding Ig-like lectin 10 isoform X2 [Siniperca chuatsi]|nr:sialic acid-binding Ig-like lectin 10 isoform X2 [Siniperca chuatsi]